MEDHWGTQMWVGDWNQLVAARRAAKKAAKAARKAAAKAKKEATHGI